MVLPGLRAALGPDRRGSEVVLAQRDGGVELALLGAGVVGEPMARAVDQDAPKERPDEQHSSPLEG